MREDRAYIFFLDKNDEFFPLILFSQITQIFSHLHRDPQLQVAENLD